MIELNLKSLDEKEREHSMRMAGILPEEKIRQSQAFIRQEILEYWNDGDVLGVFAMLGNGYAMPFVYDNLHLLKEKGLYEKALLYAYQGVRTNFSGWSNGVIEFLFRQADPETLRACGDPVPDEDPVTLYRGVAGKGKQRRVSGVSWTTSLGVAAWYARRFKELPDPAIFKLTVPNGRILAALQERSEDECLLLPPFPKKPVRMKSEQWATESWRPTFNAPPAT